MSEHEKKPQLKQKIIIIVCQAIGHGSLSPIALFTTSRLMHIISIVSSNKKQAENYNINKTKIKNLIKHFSHNDDLVRILLSSTVA